MLALHEVGTHVDFCSFVASDNCQHKTTVDLLTQQRLGRFKKTGVLYLFAVTCTAYYIVRFGSETGSIQSNEPDPQATHVSWCYQEMFVDQW